MPKKAQVLEWGIVCGNPNLYCNVDFNWCSWFVSAIQSSISSFVSCIISVWIQSQSHQEEESQPHYLCGWHQSCSTEEKEKGKQRSWILKRMEKSCIALLAQQSGLVCWMIGPFSFKYFVVVMPYSRVTFLTCAPMSRWWTFGDPKRFYLYLDCDDYFEIWHIVAGILWYFPIPYWKDNYNLSS